MKRQRPQLINARETDVIMSTDEVRQEEEQTSFVSPETIERFPQARSPGCEERFGESCDVERVS